MNSTEGCRLWGTFQIGHRWASTREVSIGIIQVCFTVFLWFWFARQQILEEIVLRRQRLVQVLFLGGWLVQELFPGSCLVWKLFSGCLASRLPCLQGLLNLPSDNRFQKLVWNDNFSPLWKLIEENTRWLIGTLYIFFIHFPSGLQIAHKAEAS